MAENASRSNQNALQQPTQQHRQSDTDDSDEIREAIASFIEPAFFDGGGGGNEQGSAYSQRGQPQQLYPHSYSQGSLARYSQAPVPQLPQALPQLPRMAWQHTQMNDPFAALMSVSTAAAAMDGNASVGAAGNVDTNNSNAQLGMSDPTATAAALAAGDYMKVGVSACVVFAY